MLCTVLYEFSTKPPPSSSPLSASVVGFSVALVCCAFVCLRVHVVAPGKYSKVQSCWRVFGVSFARVRLDRRSLRARRAGGAYYGFHHAHATRKHSQHQHHEHHAMFRARCAYSQRAEHAQQQRRTHTRAHKTHTYTAATPLLVLPPPPEETPIPRNIVVCCAARSFILAQQYVYGWVHLVHGMLGEPLTLLQRRRRCRSSGGQAMLARTHSTHPTTFNMGDDPMMLMPERERERAVSTHR